MENPRAVRGVRHPILESWRRSAAAGLDPAQVAAPVELDEQEAGDSFAEHPLAQVLPSLGGWLAEIASDAEHLVMMSDADGLVLWTEGDARTRRRATDEVNLVPGTRWTEQTAGTNAVGAALAADHAIQVFAGEHFSDGAQSWTCAAAPVHDPVSAKVIGAIALAAHIETVHPHSLALVSTAAMMLEAQLLPALGVPAGVLLSPATARAEEEPRPVLSLEVLGRDRAYAQVGDRAMALSQRHSETLLLLASQPAGMSAEQLAIALYGDEGKPVTARAEMSRLRRLLGPRILQTDPYRLEVEVESDFRAVQELLREQRVAEAAERYAGPALPRSEAPGVVDLRNELDGWTRRAVLASEDVEALWSWLNTSSGEDDLQAWRRFVANVPHGDGRRGLAAARLERLRPLFSPAGEAAPRAPMAKAA